MRDVRTWVLNGLRLVLALLVLEAAPDPGRADTVCDADCNGSRTVRVDEIIYCVNVVMGTQPLEGCPSCDADQNGTVQVNDLVAAVNDALEGCRLLGGPAPCPDYVPETCTELPTTVPPIIDHCYKVTTAGTYIGGNVNIIENPAAGTKGALYVVEDPGKTIDIRVNSLLVEKGGTLQAGSPRMPLRQAGRQALDRPLRRRSEHAGDGAEPAAGHPVPDRTPGSRPAAVSPGRDLEEETYYCTAAQLRRSVLVDARRRPTNPKNYLLEHYGNLNFDPTSWGYKVLAVSYGGSLDLFGYKGAQTVAGTARPDGRARSTPTTTCTVPTRRRSRRSTPPRCRPGPT